MFLHVLFAFLFSIATPLRAQTFRAHGDDGRFTVDVWLHDRTEADRLLPGTTTLVDFKFAYRPSGTTHSPRELFYVDVFGRKPFVLTRDDVELSPYGKGVSGPGPGVSGFYLLFELKPAARARIKGYRFVALGMGGFGNPHPPHQVLLLNHDDDNAPDKFKPSLWHRLYVGDKVFLEPLVECERRLDQT